MNLWFTYLLWNALADQPDKVCNTLYKINYVAGIEVFMQLSCAAITLFVLAIQTTSDHKIRDSEKEEHYIFRLNFMAFLNQFALMMAPCFYLYVFFNFGTVRLGPNATLHYPTVKGFWAKLAMLWGSFFSYLASHLVYLCVKWTEPKNHIQNERDEEEEDPDVTEDED